MIKLDDICFAYDSTPVLKHFSTEVADGEFVVIKGDNGCGKSTLLNIINALEFAEIGTYTFDGAGKMTQVPVLLAGTDFMNGLVRLPDGKVQYYVDGKNTFAGLVRRRKSNLPTYLVINYGRHAAGIKAKDR